MSTLPEVFRDQEYSIAFNTKSEVFRLFKGNVHLDSFGEYGHALNKLRQQQVTDRFARLREIAEAQQAAKSDYQVFYLGHKEQRKYARQQGGAYGTQITTVRAESHRAALCEAASGSEHGQGERYLVVGPEPQSARFDRGQIQVRKFEVTRHGKYSDTVAAERVYDFVTQPWDNQHRFGAAGYTVTEL